MATVQTLKKVLLQRATVRAASLGQPLTDAQYSAGFDILRVAEDFTYRDFIIPQLSQLLATSFGTHDHVSALEIGPGPKSILGDLPNHLRRKITKYTAFEPNSLFATSLEEWLCSPSKTLSPLPSLQYPPDIYRKSFVPDDDAEKHINDGVTFDETYDIILVCHSMYGMKPGRDLIERALSLIVQRPQSGIVAVFHREGTLDLDGLTCNQMASFPTGVIRVADDDEALDYFASFVAGFIIQDAEVGKVVKTDWREVCRTSGSREGTYPNHLLFSSPIEMVVFNQDAKTLTEITEQMVVGNSDTRVKSWQARLRRPASIVRPTQVQHIQQCVQWARRHKFCLTILGGGHSSHCLWTNTVAVDMGSFDQIQLLPVSEGAGDSDFEQGPLVVVGAGCKTGDIVRKTMAAGMTIPLGARPSIGAGLWLQGGIGHLARLHGLSCDAIVGAVLVSVNTSDVYYVGCVPSQHRPADAIRPDRESDLLWALKGAGTNFGIVVSVTFKTFPAPSYLSRTWSFPLKDKDEGRLKLRETDELIATKLQRDHSIEAYLYWDVDQLHMVVTMFETSTTKFNATTPLIASIDAIWGPEARREIKDGMSLFEAEIYMSSMHGGHGGGRTSAFKRCLFLKRISEAQVVDRLLAAIETRPTPLSYLHLLQGGGKIRDAATDATAFGCRDWDFACVITGVWPRNQDGSEIAQSAVKWVYSVAESLLSLSSGTYSADLGPDPRDATLAAKAFGMQRLRLARLKRIFDPCNMLAYACPLLRAPQRQKLIISVTGESGAGKDYCANIWASIFEKYTFTTHVVSISELTKRQYAAATGADPDRLLEDRAYKETHRPALTAFFQDQVRKRPELPKEHFKNVISNAGDVDVLIITGMRDEAPVAAFSHLVPESRMLEIRIEASQQTRLERVSQGKSVDNSRNEDCNNSRSNEAAVPCHPNLVFNNGRSGNDAATKFAENHLLCFVHEELERLADMVCSTPNFPTPGIEFRHVLGIARQPGGLALCISLLQAHFAGDWATVGAVVCCEVGGLIYASALASHVNTPLVLIREAGKLPPPIISVTKHPSHICSMESSRSREVKIEMERNVVPKGASVVVVDDVLSTGSTLCAVLQLLSKASINIEDIAVMVVAEFPIHRGRELLRQHGFGTVSIQSLLIFGGA
ncbi:hypothetical protein BKA66DRAFT_468882 [Pyrenochaeta sp. MPI-SDFR-AT-0127]|nr:hypothetical protein BKA66DRAFT_468882 [Pyrenochaeta sp. MPI-SDFR-AT-0127]